MSPPPGPRVGVAGLVHETSTYADAVLGRTGRGAFAEHEGADLVEAFAGTDTYVGGILDGLEVSGAVAVPLRHAEAEPSGTIERGALEGLVADLVDAVTTTRLDAVVVELHGAAVADGVDDVETDLARALRAALGPAVPLVATLDLHANLSPATLHHLDAVVPVARYPHDDQADAGRRAARLAVELLGGRRLVTAVVPVPILLPTTTTSHRPGAVLLEWIDAIESLPDVAVCRPLHGFPYTDTPLTRASVVCTVDHDPARAHRLADRFARRWWERREEFRPQVVEPAAAVARAVELIGRRPGRPVVVNETSDNCGGGAPGDATHLLEPVLAARVPGAVFGFVCDPVAARHAHVAGVGATVDLELGGRGGRWSGRPVSVRAEVAALADGRFELRGMGAGRRVDLGASARLRVDGPCDVIVVSERAQTFDDAVFELHGVDVRSRPLVALKGSHHFRTAFAPVAHEIVTADGPGLTTLRVDRFDRRRTPRPIWPLDAVDRHPRSG